MAAVVSVREQDEDVELKGGKGRAVPSAQPIVSELSQSEHLHRAGCACEFHIYSIAPTIYSEGTREREAERDKHEKARR